MAASIKDLRRRLRTVKSTEKITRAMETVSSVKMKRAQTRLTAARPYAKKLVEIVGALSSDEAAAEHPLLARREVKRRTLIVIAADRGLCGAFNANVLREFDAFMREHGPETVDVIPVGKRAAEHCRRRRYSVVMSVSPHGGQAEAENAQRIMQEQTLRFMQGEVDEVQVLFTELVSLARFEPKRAPLLPLEVNVEGDASPEARLNYIFEPSPEQVLGSVLPRIAESRLYLAMAESVASEHSARRMAMHNATDNCKELGRQLTLDINRARQASITKEILEIVGGAEALKG